MTTTVNQFIYGNEVALPLSSIKNGELYFDDIDDKIGVYRKTKRGSVLVKTVNDYGELSKVKGINNEPSMPNFIHLNP